MQNGKWEMGRDAFRSAGPIGSISDFPFPLFRSIFLPHAETARARIRVARRARRAAVCAPLGRRTTAGRQCPQSRYRLRCRRARRQVVQRWRIPRRPTRRARARRPRAIHRAGRRFGSRVGITTAGRRRNESRRRRRLHLLGRPHAAREGVPQHALRGDRLLGGSRQGGEPDSAAAEPRGAQVS